MGVGALGLFCLLMLIPFLGTERFQRLFDFRQGTSFLRLQLWRGSLQMALDHPWLGVGPDNFLYAYRSTYLLPAAWEEPSLNHPHNWILDWWTRLGLPGLALGLLPGVWEDWQPVVWRAVCGVVAGSLSVGLHHAVEAALPAAVARLLTGAGIASGMAEDTATGEFVTVADSLDGRLADTDELHAVEWED